MEDTQTAAKDSSSGGEPSENSYHPLEPSFYSRPPQPGSAQYEQQHQYDANYGYYPLNQGNPGSGGTYPEPQQRNFSPNYTQQQSPHYTALSPASPASTGFHYSNHHTSSQTSAQQTHHGMNYTNPQQSIYSTTVSPGHYGSPNHGQHSNYSPNNSQQWPPQQASPADYTHHSSSSPQRSVLAGSPSGTPSPAHTPTSPPPSSAAGPAMSGQFPAHHHGRHPMGSPQSAQGHGLPPWGHPGAGQSQGMGMHPGGGIGGGPPQAPSYFPPPHPSMVGPGRTIQGPPQHAHMSSAPGADRHSPHHPVVPGAWNNLGMPVTKAPGTHESGRGPPASSHPQTNSGGGSGGSGNPLFSLQMLVNQEMSRNAAAAAQAGSYRGQTPTAAHQQESVDLSPASGEAYPRLPQQSVPIPLTRTEKQPEHSSVRNGSIIASSPSVSSTNVTSPPTPLNGEVSSDSGIGSSSIGPAPSSLPDHSNRDISKTKSVVESKSPVTKETVSVIAQTPPRDKPKCVPQVVTTVASSSSSSISSSSSTSPQTSESKMEKKVDSHSSASSEPRQENSKPSPVSERETAVQPIRPSSADNQERNNPIIRTTSPGSAESSNISAPPSNSSSVVKQPDDNLSIPSPTQSTAKDSTSPVRSPKSGSLKRTKKVDSILENLVESGCKKFVNASAGIEQPPQVPVSTVVVAPASVIVSPAVTNEDSSSGFGRDVRTPSPGVSSQKPSSVTLPKSPATIREEDVVSPTFSNDDVDNGKPRRKRKLDKPIRVSKTSDTEGPKSATVEEPSVPEETPKPQDLGLPIGNKEVDPVCPSTESVPERKTEKSDELLAKDLSNNVVEKAETTRRRSSSEGSSALLSPKSVNQRTRRKSTSDHQDDADALLSALVSDQLDKPQEPKPEVKNAFIEVETELEKMFAGIVETDEAVDPLKLEEASSPVSMEVSPTTKALETLTNLGSTPADSKPVSSMKRGRPKGSRNGTRRSSESIFGTSSTDSTPKKKKKQTKRPLEDSPGTSQPKKMKRSKLFPGDTGSNSRDSPLPKRKGSSGLVKSETGSGGQRDLVQAATSYDSGSNTSSSRSRGPVIHVEGPKDSPYYVTVINAPSRGDEEDGNEKGGAKKQALGSTRRKNTSYHNDLEYRGKVSRASGKSLGLFSSTLSARYDAHTSDPTWICVFCKRGPHSTTEQSTMGNGDLFGPYLVGKEKPDDGGVGSPFIGCEPSADEKDITEEQKRGGKNKRSLRGAEMVEQFRQKMSKKVKRSVSFDNSPVLGMVPISPSGGAAGKDEACFEVWVHEECAVWAAGVHLVGSRIVGLQEAVWGAVRTVCSKCGEGGANVGCVRRACEWRLHYGCAVSQGWDLDEEAYIARCHQHKNGTHAPESILPT